VSDYRYDGERFDLAHERRTCHNFNSRSFLSFLLKDIIMKFRNIATALGALSLVGTVHADPTPDLTCRVFCFRVTDIGAAKNDPQLNRFSFEFEVLNWSDTFAGGVLLVLGADSSPGVSFATDNFFNLNGVDVDGRPIQLEDTNGDSVIDAQDLEDANSNGILDPGEDKNANNRLDNDPIPGNLNRPNDWTLIAQTNTKMEWRLGTPVPYINLLGAQFCSECIETIPRNPGIVNPVTGEVNPLESIDNGDNVLDGFVMTVDGMDVGDTIHINWFLLGAGSATTPLEPSPPAICRVGGAGVPVGDPIGVAGFGNQMGFGMITITRVDGIDIPGPVFVGNTGVRQTGVEFFDNVWIVPDPAEMAMEFSAGISARPANAGDMPRGAKVNAKKIGGHGGGDPHFSTWSGERFDFHGECDVVLVQNPNFGNGLGMHIHGRTKIHSDWSAFESAAIMIGDDILEIHGQNEQWINGVDIEFPAYIGGYSVTMQQPAKHIRRFIVHLGDGERIFIKTFKEFLYVEMEGSRTRDFAGTIGMLGSFESGHKVGRDHQTIMTDPTAFGMEWQVRDTDPQLFHFVDGPQFPDRCMLPEHPKTESVKSLRRNLKTISQEDAKKACSTAGAAYQEDCIADVIATHNLEMAGAY
jgi:hypothetical protein